MTVLIGLSDTFKAKYIGHNVRLSCTIYYVHWVDHMDMDMVGLG